MQYAFQKKTCLGVSACFLFKRRRKGGKKSCVLLAIGTYAYVFLGFAFRCLGPAGLVERDGTVDLPWVPFWVALCLDD